MNAEIKRFDRIHDVKKNSDFRILHLNKDSAIVVTITKEPRMLDIYPIGQNTLITGISNGTYEIVKEEPSQIVDTDKLPEHVRVKYERNKLIVETINRYFGPDYSGLYGKHPKPVVKEIVERSGLDLSSVLRIIYKYIQSGCRESSLLRKKCVAVPKDTTTAHKRGRKAKVKGQNGKNLSKEDRSHMFEYMQIYLKEDTKSMKNCYDDMISAYYTTTKHSDSTWIPEELPPDQCPSFYQFEHYIREHSTQKERLSAKMGYREFRNQRRVLTGTARSGVSGPGDIIEMDACEIDVAAVSETDRSKPVGSPVVYFMIDVFSRLIVGASISYDNNSIVAMTNCLASLVEDRAAILSKYKFTLVPLKSGITMEDIMPTNIKPHIIRTDHGSDFISKEANRIQHETGITLEYVPPGTGSYKGIVERFFRAFQKDWLVDLAYKAGAKKHTGVSKHNKEAKLSIEDIRELMYKFIFQYNAVPRASKSGITPNMVNSNVGNCPAEMWRYGIEHYGSPDYINDKEQFLYSLLLPVNAKISRRGIEYKHIRYVPDINNDRDIERIMLNCKYGSKSFKIRIDPRDNSNVYYLDKSGKLWSAPMLDDVINRNIKGKTWAETEKFLNDVSNMVAEKAVEGDKIRRFCRRDAKEIVQKAKNATGTGKLDVKNMRETRTAEKERVRKEHSITKMLEDDSVAPALEVPDEPKAPEIEQKTVPERKDGMTDEEYRLHLMDLMEEKYK